MLRYMTDGQADAVATGESVDDPGVRHLPGPAKSEGNDWNDWNEREGVFGMY